MEINIDYRETTLYDIIYKKNIDNYHLNVKNLEIGDIEICYNDIKLIFERKTISDLFSSIKDGRYKEQKLRMVSTYDINRCTYIIEKSRPMSDTDNYIIDSAIIHSMFRDKIRFICVNSINDTVDWILKIATRLLKNPQNFNEQSENSVKYIECTKIKSKKIDNIDKNTCYLLQLSQIPGISKVIAEEIVKTFPTMKDFYNSDVTIDKLKSIASIGDKKAKMIYDYMF